MYMHTRASFSRVAAAWGLLHVCRCSSRCIHNKWVQVPELVRGHAFSAFQPQLFDLETLSSNTKRRRLHPGKPTEKEPHLPRFPRTQNCFLTTRHTHLYIRLLTSSILEGEPMKLDFPTFRCL